MAEIRVTKIEAARRQIDVAIRLLFSNDDPVAVHTLASAGVRILRDVSEKKEAAKMHQFIRKMIRPGKERDFWKAYNKPANFFKHAQSDSEQVLDGVQEEINDFQLLIASIYYQDLGYILTPEMTALQMWFAEVHAEVMLPGAAIESQLVRQNATLLSAMSRPEHLALGKKILEYLYQTRRST